MKLKEDFIIHESADGDVLLAVGEEAQRFHGIVKLNETAGFIVRQNLSRRFIRNTRMY